MYAKLNNGEIEFAPINKPINDGMIYNYGEDVNLLTQDGFLPYSEDEMPILTDGQTLSFEYKQTKSGITKKYIVTGE